MSDNLQEKIEDRIIDYINLSAGGRLTVFRPEEKIKGVNLIVKRKGEYDPRKPEAAEEQSVIKAKIFGKAKRKATKDIQLFISGQIKTSSQISFKKEVNIKDLENNKNLYLVFTFLNVLKQDIDDNLCFMSFEEFKKNIEANQGGISTFESFLSGDKKDKYSKFLINKKDLSKILLKMIYV